MNKFLEQYPQLWEPNIGDCIEVIATLNWNMYAHPDPPYSIGQVGYIISIGDIDDLISIAINGNMPTVYKVDFMTFKSWLYKAEMKLYEK